MPFNGECRKLVSFFFGCIAHTVEDFNFDRYFVREVGDQTFKGNIGKGQDWTDIGLDFITMVEKKRFFSASMLYVPTADLHAIYKSVG